LLDSKARGNTWMNAELIRLRVSILSSKPDITPDTLRSELEAGLAFARQVKNRVHESRSLCMAHRLNITNPGDYLRMKDLAAELVEGGATEDILELRSIAEQRA